MDVVDQPIVDSSRAAPAVADQSSTLSRTAPASTRWWIELGAAAIVATVYLLSPRSVPSPSLIEQANVNSRRLFELERMLGVDIEHTVQRAIAAAHLTVISNWSYGTLHFVVTAATLVYLYRVRPRDYVRWRTAFVVSCFLAFVCYRLWPVTPPRLLVGPDGRSLLVDTLASDSAPWTFDSGAISQVANQYAAMPSMHAGWALFCALALGLGRTPRVRLALLGYPAAITVVIMASGNHYLLDAIGGFVAVGLGFAVCRIGVTVIRRTKGSSTWTTHTQLTADRTTTSPSWHDGSRASSSR